MKVLEIGSRVSLKKETLDLSYLKGRHWYTNMYEGKKGRVIGFTAENSYAPLSNKVAIEFDDVVFTRPDGQISSHDNGCHGKGKKQYCWYIPASCLNLIELSSDNELLLMTEG
jgi:hypothetical protein